MGEAGLPTLMQWLCLAGEHSPAVCLLLSTLTLEAFLGNSKLDAQGTVLWGRAPSLHQSSTSAEDESYSKITNKQKNGDG
jgi:hypothetical protein